MRERIKQFLCDWLTEERLSKYRWYRRRVGGFWVHSSRMGWRKEQDQYIEITLQCFHNSPGLYDYGAQIEDYRA